MERYKTLCQSAELRFSQLEITNIVTDHRDGLKGWAGQAPYDRIILAGSVGSLPKALCAQLSSDGQLLYVSGDNLMKYQDGEAAVCTSLSLPLLEAGVSRKL